MIKDKYCIFNCPCMKIYVRYIEHALEVNYIYYNLDHLDKFEI
jgi:hypothetical protein